MSAQQIDVHGLPELPVPASALALAAWGPKPDYFTEWQMRDYARAAVEAALRQSGDAVAQINAALGEAFKDDQVGAMKAHAAVMQIITRLAAPPATSGLVEALRIARDYAAYANAEPSDIAMIDAALAAHDARGAA